MTVRMTDTMLEGLAKASTAGLIVPRTENNQYLKVSYKGSGGIVPSSWNVKIYTSGSVVTNDEVLLTNLIEGTAKRPDVRKKVIQIDDSGWGFPLCGVMVGLSDGQDMMTGVVDIRWFREGVFESKRYLKEYSRIAQEILEDHFFAKSATHRIEICTGYINSTLKDDLRAIGFDVSVAKITGFLQDNLEIAFKDYVHLTTGQALAYDPKELPSKGDIAKRYDEVLSWGKKNAPHLIKDGWLSIQRKKRSSK